MTSSFDEICKEVIVLNDILRKQEFRTCLIKHFSTKLKQLRKESSGVEEKILERLQFKLVEPLKFYLKTSNNSNDKCLILECLIDLVLLALVNDVNEFFDLYTLAFFQIYKGCNSVHQQSEELKMLVLEFCTSLMKNSNTRILDKIYCEEQGAKFSLGISISINILIEEKSVQLRILALDFLHAASRYQVKPKYNEGLFKKVGDLFAMYLPGILAPLIEVIIKNETQHHLITVKAISCCGHIICLVLSDMPQTENLSENDIIQQWLKSKKELNKNLLDRNKVLKQNKRTQDWVNAAAIALQPLIVKISEVRKHSHPHVRLELTHLMIKLIKNCTVNLKNSLTPIIDVLVASTVDEDEVSEVAERALKDFELECNKKSARIFVSVVEQNLYSVITKLPKNIQAGDEELTLSLLKSFAGYLKTLGRLNKLEHLLSFSSTLKKLLLVIQISVELELYPEIASQDFSIWDTDTNLNIWAKPWKRFRHFVGKPTHIQIKEICQILGKYAKPEIVFDFLLDALNENHYYKKELILITNEVILGANQIPDHVVRQLLDFYLDPMNLYLPLQVNEENGINFREVQINIIKVALLLEGIGELATNLGKSFEHYLLEALYFVLEKMGNSFAVIRETATQSAGKIAKACGWNGNINNLITNNVDYITYHLTVKLKRNHLSVFDVITVLMKNSSFETLSNIEEIMYSVLKSSSGNFDSPHTLAYLRLFQTFVLCVRRWLEPSKTRKSSTEEPKKNQDTEADLFVKYLKNLQPEPKEEDEEEIQSNEENEEILFDDQEKVPLPRHIKMTVEVTNHCLHFLPSKDKNKKLIVLEILNESVWILAEWENELLPMVHKIWSPLVTRFDQIDDPLIINRSFALLCSLCHLSKSFIRSRTLKEVLPALRSFLTRQAPNSRLKDVASGYFYTQNFKLQMVLLENLGKVTSSLELFEIQTDLVTDCGLPYLSSYQPKQLQEKCRILFLDLKAYDPYLVYFKLIDFIENSEYSKNVKAILYNE